MTREEFEQQLHGMHPVSEGNRLPTNEEYELIEYVYMHHPSISDNGSVGKLQIASLYTNFGMPIIKDMKPRAEEMESLHKQFNEVKRSEEEILDKMKEMRE